MGAVGLALIVGGLALLSSALVFLIPVRSSGRYPPQESFEDSQRRIEQYLSEMRKNRGKVDGLEEAPTLDRLS